MSNLNLPVEQRYACAQSEINDRLSSRQNVHTAFATVVIAGVPIITNYVVSVNSSPDYDLIIVAIFIGLMAFVWSYVFWICHNDSVIGLLSTYCKEIEKRDDPNNTQGIPAWHNDAQGWIQLARDYRKLSDLGGIFLVLFTVTAAIPVATRYFVMPCFSGICGDHIVTGFFSLGAILVNLTACTYLYRNKYIRSVIAQGRLQQDSSGTYQFVVPRTPLKTQIWNYLHFKWK